MNRHIEAGLAAAGKWINTQVARNALRRQGLYVPPLANLPEVVRDEFDNRRVSLSTYQTPYQSSPDGNSNLSVVLDQYANRPVAMHEYFTSGSVTEQYSLVRRRMTLFGYRDRVLHYQRFADPNREERVLAAKYSVGKDGQTVRRRKIQGEIGGEAVSDNSWQVAAQVFDTRRQDRIDKDLVLPNL